MSCLTRIAAIATGVTLVASGAGAAPTLYLPVFGHYIGYGVVTSATAGVCPQVQGTQFMNQLELNTPREKLVVKVRQVFYGTGDPSIVEEVFDKGSGTRDAPAGNVAIHTEGDPGSAVTGTYSATYTPLDPNSLGATVQVTYTPAGQTASCSETDQLVFVRSSAD